MDFSTNLGDDDVRSKGGRFKAKDETTYRASMGWLSVPTIKDGKVVAWDDEAAFPAEGGIHPDAKIRYTGCDRVYIKGCGYVMYAGPAYAKFLGGKKPRTTVATIIVLWPTDSEGDLDEAKFKAGKGWDVKSFVFDLGKYNDIKAKDKRFALTSHDISMACPENGSEFQKLQFTPEGESLLRMVLESENPHFQEVARRIRADIAGVALTIRDDVARLMTVSEIEDKLSGKENSPAKSKSLTSGDVKSLLGGL